MRFSKKAQQYLSKLTRKTDYVSSDREAVINYLTAQNIPLFEKVIDFQVNFSGLHLTIHNHPSSTFRTFLFDAAAIISNEPVEPFEKGGKKYFHCGDHETAQFYFLLSEDGEICTEAYREDEATTIHASVDKFIEVYAMENILNEKGIYEHPGYFDLIDNEKFETLTRDYFRDPVLNDQYDTWMEGEDIIIRRGIWLGRGGYYVHLYNGGKQKCEAFVNLLRENKIII